MTAPASARQIAWRCLVRIDHHGAYANLVVPAELAASALAERDRRLVTELVYGTTRRRRSADALVDRFVTREPEPEIRSLLRLGAYQLLSGVAAHAAVSETVGLAPRRARGFVNAVLRAAARAPIEAWPTLGTELSYPEWIVVRLGEVLGGPRARAVLKAMNEPAVTHRRADGYVQDLASQWVVEAVGARPGERIADLCAAPGGKSTGLSSRGAHVVAADVHPGRARLIESNVRSLRQAPLSPPGGTVAVIVADAATAPFPDASFDRVLLDAPCSGLGSLRRRPDARWRVTPDDVVELAGLQRRLLIEAARLVRPGGALVYSVCTFLPEESIDHPVPDGFAVDTAQPDGPWEPYAHGWRLVPDRTDTDGMVVVRLRRGAPAVPGDYASPA